MAGITEGDTSNQAVLHLIDPFLVVPDSDLTARPWMARWNVSLAHNGRVVWHRDYCHQVVQRWREDIDFLFIDRDHAYEACRRDWDTWHLFIHTGGVVLFHDARLGLGAPREWDGWPGPSFVVNELFRGANALSQWRIVDEAGSLVVVQKVA